MTKPAFYITTPIYYPSADLHIGHAYCTTIADTIARYKRANGFDVQFITGSDEHGLKIQRKAESFGVKPIEYTDKIVADFKKLWEMLGVSYTSFVRTSSPEHEKTVQTLLQKVWEQGDIYKKDYEGLYCVPCESFWTEHQVEEAGGVCPDCGRPVEKMRESSYFFRMSKYADRILEYIETHPDFIQPVSRRNEMINFIKQGLEDLCISRSSFDWGIQVPFDPKHVVYVWFDALLAYFTGIGFGRDMDKFNRFWPADLHLVGKEIVRFHTIIWPAMLMAMGFDLPKEVYGHGWLVVDGDKMSKSKGEFLTVSLLEQKGYDPLAYRLFCLQSHYRKSLVFTWENLDNAQVTYNKLVAKVAALKPDDGELDEEAMTALRAKFTAALDNDLNTSLAVTSLYDVLKYKTNDATKLYMLADFDRVLGLDLIKKGDAKREELKKQAAVAGQFTVISESGEADAEVEAQITARQDAKKAKNYAEADRIRDELKARGIEVTDVPNGAKWKRI